MNKLIYTLIAATMAIGIVSCSKKGEDHHKWEYKTLEIRSGEPAYSGLEELDKFYPSSISIPQAQMDTLGAHGWELVDVYTHIETVHPNFGDAKYVTGLQPNTRTSAVFYVFKRPKQDGKENEKAVESTSVEADTVVAEVVAVEEVAADSIVVAE